MKGIFSNFSYNETLSIMSAIKVGSAVTWEEFNGKTIVQKQGIVLSVWKGKDPRLVIKGVQGTHYLRDMSTVRVYSQKLDYFVSAKNIGRV